MASRPSLSCESTQACAHVSWFRDLSHSRSSSSPSPYTLESPSIYATFKVLQLVNTFRKKVTRKHTAQATTKKLSSRNVTADDFCQDFERQAFEDIDRYLGRKTRDRRKRKPRKVTADTARPCCAVPAGDGPVENSIIEKLLQQLDQSVRFGEDSTQTVARNDHLFLRRQSALFVQRLSVKEFCEVLVLVKDLLTFLEHPHRVRTISEGDELVNYDIDETYTGNLVHLLLHIQGELLRLLVARIAELVHQHVSDCQKDQSKHSEEWFFEFPDARHPLSTTWPWSGIKPSLAVLWGVCWQFFDHFAPPQFDEEGNLVNERGEIEISAQAVYAFLSQTQATQSQQQQQQQQQMQATGEFMSEVKEEDDVLTSFVNAASRQAYSAHQALGNPCFPRSVPYPSSAEMESSQPLLPRGLTRTSLSHSPHHPPVHHTTRTPDQAAHTPSGLAFAHTNTLLAYATQPPSTYAQESAWPLPQDTNLDFSNAYGPAAAVEQAWNQGIPVSYPAPHTHAHSHFQTRPIGRAAPLPPRHSRHPSTPAIIATDLSPFPQQQQPEDYNNNAYSATSVSTNSSIPLRESTSLANYQNPQFNPGHLSPHSPYMADTIPEARIKQTTTPPRSPHDIPIAEPMTRKRSHSQISNGLPFQPADGSHHGSQMGEEEFEPSRMSIHRPEPLMNDQRKYMCNFGGEECEQLTFDRKCEWSKHMDKHDRPYRCPDPGCAKLLGFTYSGGLLRHEREVHGKHGGPKAQLMCPFPECKRHSGKGFTRKENLNEHVRRVHQNREQPSQTQPGLSKQDTDFEALAGATRAMDETTETPASRISEAVMVKEDLQLPGPKRRRHVQPGTSDHSASEDAEGLRRHIEHLQQENAQKDQRLLDMERMVAEMDRKLQEQQRAQQEMFEHQQTAATAAAIASAAQQA